MDDGESVCVDTKSKVRNVEKYLQNVYKRKATYHPGTSSGSSQLPVPSASPILKTVPMGQPYSRA